MTEIDNSIVKSVVETYSQFPLDKGTTQSFAEGIFPKINMYRMQAANPPILDGDSADQEGLQMQESYCHAFYRMLGLPVISSTLQFYNPGYYGKDMTAFGTSRDLINKKQHDALVPIERLRESFCYTSTLAFTNKGTASQQLKLDLLKYPRPIDVLSEQDDPFTLDNKGLLPVPGRSDKTARTAIVLRPFKCNALVTPLEKSKAPPKIAAPFYNSRLDGEIEKLYAPYLETVCRARFNNASKAKMKGMIETLKESLSVVQVNGKNPFQKLLDDQSVVEIFVSNIVFAMFVQICLQYADVLMEYKNITAKLDASAQRASVLTTQVDSLNAKYNFYTEMKGFLPDSPSQYVKGVTISSNNPQSGTLVSELMNLIDSPGAATLKELQSSQQTLDATKGEINSISKDMFNYCGEVMGIGIIHIVAIMLAFWMIPKDALISMLDEASFSRLYNDPNNTFLRSETVQKRQDKQGPLMPISQAIKELDGSVFQLLSLADAIIKYSIKDKQK